MRVLSIDLASKSYGANGIVVLEQARDVVRARVLKPRDLGLTDRPAVEPFAKALVACCDREGIQTVLIDGPQGWKDPHNGLEDRRRCELLLNAMGKAGLPGHTKPANSLAYIGFSVALFEELTRRGFGLLGGAPAARLALEIYPAAAWKQLGIKPLPAKAKCTASDMQRALDALRDLFDLRCEDELTHDELQALVAAFAGFAVERGHTEGYVAAGVPPARVDGTWREGFIVNPTREALGPL